MPTPYGVFYPNELQEQQQDLQKGQIENKLAELKLEHDLEGTNWLKNILPGLDQKDPNAIMQSALGVGSPELINTVRETQKFPLEMQDIQSQINQRQSMADYKNWLIKNNVLPGQQSFTAQEVAEYQQNHKNPDGSLPSKQQAKDALTSSNVTASTDARLNAQANTVKNLIGPEGMQIMAAKSLFLNEKPSGFLGGLINAELASKYPDLLKNVIMPNGQPATAQDMGLVRGQISALKGAYDYQMKWKTSVENRASLLESALPELQRLYNALPVTARSVPMRDLQTYYQKNIKGNPLVGAYITMQNEVARDYNLALISGATGSAGAGGTGQEREQVYGQLDQTLPPETFMGQAMGATDMIKVRKKGIDSVLNSIQNKMDKATGGNGLQILAPTQDFSNVETLIKQNMQQAGPNTPVPPGNYTLDQIFGGTP